MIRPLAPSLLLSLVGFGCAHPQLAASPATSATNASSASASGGDGGAYDAAVVALARPVLACEFDDDGPKSDCAAFDAWKSAEIWSDLKAPIAGTLVAMLGDADPKMRMIAAERLTDVTLPDDVAAASGRRIVAAAEAEKSPLVRPSLGEAVAHVAYDDDADLRARVEKLAKTAPVDLRAPLVGALPVAHRDLATFQLVMAQVDDPEEDVRRKAVDSFFMGASAHPKEVCAFWRQHFADAHDEVSSSAVHLVTFSGECAGEYDALLDFEKKQIAAKKSGGFWHLQALGDLATDKGGRPSSPTPAQKGRAGALLKQIVDDASLRASDRGDALEIVVKFDRAAAAALAKKYATNPEMKAACATAEKKLAEKK